MHCKVYQQHVVHHSSNPYQVDLNTDMQGTTRMTGSTPNNRHNYRPEVGHIKGESRATMAMAEGVKQINRKFCPRMQNQPLMTSALSTINWFDGTDKSDAMSWLDQVEVVAEGTTKHHQR